MRNYGACRIGYMSTCYQYVCISKKGTSVCISFSFIKTISPWNVFFKFTRKF